LGLHRFVSGFYVGFHLPIGGKSLSTWDSL
jgi:hypothetical protein